MPRRGVGVLGDCAVVPAHVAGDLPEPGSLREHLVDLGVADLTALRHRALRFRDGFRRVCWWDGGLLNQAALVLG